MELDTTIELTTCDGEPLRERIAIQPVRKCKECGQVLVEEKGLRVARVYIESLMHVAEGKKLGAEESVGRYALGQKLAGKDVVILGFEELKLLRETLLVRYGGNPVIVGFCWPLLQLPEKVEERNQPVEETSEPPPA